MLHVKALRVNSKHSHHRDIFFSMSLLLYLYEMIDVHQINYDNHFMMCVSQIIMLYTLYSAVCQLYLNKT